MTIEQIDTENPNQIAQIAQMYVDAGWSDSVDTRETKRALQNSYCAFGAFENGILAGFFRAIGDGVKDAYLLDLYVYPQFRRKGVGLALTKTITSFLKRRKTEWITCISTPEGKSVYAKCGKSMKGHEPFRF